MFELLGCTVADTPPYIFLAFVFDYARSLSPQVFHMSDSKSSCSGSLGRVHVYAEIKAHRHYRLIVSTLY